MVIFPISWLKQKKMTMQLGFVNLHLTVAYDHNITNYMSKVKIPANKIYKFIHSILINTQ